MRDGFIRVCSAYPVIDVAGCTKNAQEIKDIIKKATENEVKLLVLPELTITGYALGDLFLQQTLLQSAEDGLSDILAYSSDFDMLITVGLPVRFRSSLYSCAAVILKGRLLGVVPKIHIPNYSEFYEVRHFASGLNISQTIKLAGQEAPFGPDLIFCCENMPELKLGIEICEDLWVPNPPSASLSQAGATIIANLSASTYVTGKETYRKELVEIQSARCICGYIYSSSGEGESSTDLVFSGHLMIAENGRMFENTSSQRFITADLDLRLLESERRKMNTFADTPRLYRFIPFSIEKTQYNKLHRPIERQPFVPADNSLYKSRCREVLDIQSAGLAKRLRHSHAKTAVIGVSGGLDSTLALLVCNRAIKKHGLDTKIIAITMPGPGTTSRTRGNAGKLCDAIGADMKVIPIGDALETHLRDIGHKGDFDVIFENAQARERKQIEMSVANQNGGLVVGTGDMSELALGFTTYNGDHMSMYGVNAGVPKTLVRHLVKYIADENEDNALLHDTLYDILDTPVSPELLPPDNGRIAQKTEQIIGPYELHDFFLYYFVRFGFEPPKILRLAKQTFEGLYEPEFIKSCLVVFIKRFFMSQFKRSCIPDGPKVGSVALSPRGDWRMPSDAVADEWLKSLEKE